MRRSVRLILHRLAPLAPAMALLVGCLLATVWISSCQRFEATSTPAEPLKTRDVPIVRVRLNSKPLTSTELRVTGPYVVFIDGKKILVSSNRMPASICRREGNKWRLGRIDHAGRRMTIQPQEADSYVGFDNRLYRGKLVLHATEGGKFNVNNHVDMESYLASVIAKELLPNFKPEAYKAQAVAARTYALMEMQTRGQNSNFDVWDTPRSQVYYGLTMETDKSWAAVRDTHAWVLAYGPKDQERIFLTQFSACNGGWVNGASVVRKTSKEEDIPPLQGGQRDGDGRACAYYTWSKVRLSKWNIYHALIKAYPNIAKLGGLKTINVKTETDYRRPIWLTIVGTNGKTETIRGEAFRNAMVRYGPKAAKGLRSFNCKIRDVGNAMEFYDGRGHGHGVGLSQWGAEEKAKNGMKAEDILEFYYPKAIIFRAY